MAITDQPLYATQPRPLSQQITEYLKEAGPASVDGIVVALIVPDTNLLGGGRVAAEVYRLVQGQTFDTVVLVAPSHIGSFPRINVCSVDVYRTPLGDLTVNDRMRHELCDEEDDIFLDDRGHFHPEGIDAQLPYLQTLLGAFDIVPIIMGDESPEFCRELGYAVGEVMYNRRTLLVASANLLDATEDALADFRRYFEACDVSRLMGLLNSERVRMAGKGAVLTALIAALQRGTIEARVVGVELPRDGLPGYLGAVIVRR